MNNDNVLRGEKYTHTHTHTHTEVSARNPTQDLNTSQTPIPLNHLDPWAEEWKISSISKITYRGLSQISTDSTGTNQLELRPLGNAAHVAYFPLLCQRPKWLSGESILLVFTRP